MHRLTVLLLAGLFSACAFSQFDPDQADSWLKSTYPADEPGATIIAVKDGEVVFKGAYGMANMELEVPLEPDMVLRLGSITKQFTATAIMLLEQEGKLSVNDDITQYLPDYNTQGRNITIEHLLTHTSGIPNHTAQPGWGEQYRTPATKENMFGFWQDLPLEFEPGERYQYSNSGYWILGAIVEAASGITYQEYVEERIFKPLGMGSSFHDRQQRVIPRRASGYWRNESDFFNAPFADMSRPGAAGALASSVEDLALWDASLYTEQLLPTETRQRMWAPHKLNNGELSYYGYGWAVGEHSGSPVLSHSGGVHGFTTHALRMPDQHLFVAVLSNGSRVAPIQTAQRLALSILGEDVDFEPVELTADQLKEYMGVYRINEHENRAVTLGETGLLTQRGNGRWSPARPVGGDRFVYDNSSNMLVFHRDEAGAITHQEVTGFGVAPNRAERTDELAPKPWIAIEIDPAILDDYVGAYELAPEFILNIWVEDGRMQGKATGPGQGQIPFSPRAEDEFFSIIVGAVLTFERAADGQVTGLTLDQHGRQTPAPRVEQDG